jgi:hypothetical protein
MEKRKLLIALLLIIVLICSAQVPQKFNYQAVVRDGQHAVVKNQEVGFRLSILAGSTDVPPLYVETHTVTTSAIGLASMVIGEGTVQRGVFRDIDWGSDDYFLEVEADPAGGSAYEYLGTSQLISVPYALYSGNISSPTRKFTIQEEMGHPVDSSLFEVRNKEGQTVFAVYPEGTRVYVLDEEGKGVRGGFAIGGYSRNTKGISQEYMRVTPDSIRMYFDEKDSKGVRGSFAIGGYSRNTKGVTDHYFMLKPDSARFLMVSDNPDETLSGALTVNTKSKLIGDAGEEASLFNLTKTNYFIGNKAGSSNTTGINNSFIGYESGISNTEGSGNVFLGLRSGWSNQVGNANIFIGVEAGHDNTTGNLNTAMGFKACRKNTTGDFNSMFGYLAGSANLEGEGNTYIGSNSGYNNNSGNYNTYIGAFTGSEKSIGRDNVYIGMRAGSNVSTNFNTIIGTWAGAVYDNGGDNVFVGGNAGRMATGQYSVFVGKNAGFENTGQENVFLGYESGSSCVEGSHNIFIGRASGRFNNGSDNVIIGQEAGRNSNGSGNVFIGRLAGEWVQGSDMLFIENSSADSSNCLIWGRFDQNILRLNDRVGIGRNAAEHALEVEGDAYKTASNDWATTSDARVKKDIRTIENGLEQIMKLRPVTYRYTEEWMEANPGIKDQEYYHYIAQEFAEVFPESVHRGPEVLEGDPENLLRMNSQPAQVVAIRAIQELALQNREQQVMLDKLQKENATLIRMNQEILDLIAKMQNP